MLPDLMQKQLQGDRAGWKLEPKHCRHPADCDHSFLVREFRRQERIEEIKSMVQRKQVLH